MIKIAIIEASESKQQELKTFLNAQPEFACTYISSSLAALQLYLRFHAELNVLVVSLSEGSVPAPAQIRNLKQAHPQIEILLLANDSDKEKAITWLRAGVVGYLPGRATLPQLKAAILGIHQGDAYLTPFMVREVVDFFRYQDYYKEVLTEREKEVVQCLIEGMSYKLIAFELQITVDTVRYHLRHIYRKLKVNSKGQVISKILLGEGSVKLPY